MTKQLENRWVDYTKTDWLWVGLAVTTFVPLVAGRFLGASRSAFAMVAATRLAIDAAALLA